MSKKLDVGAKTFHFKDFYQVINMGGPFIGELYEDEIMITNSVFVDSLIVNNPLTRLFFIKYHLVSKEYFFTINYYDLKSVKMYESKRKFKMLFLSKITDDDNLEAYDAFHDKFPDTKFVIDLEQELFHEVNSWDSRPVDGCRPYGGDESIVCFPFGWCCR